MENLEVDEVVQEMLNQMEEELENTKINMATLL